MENELRGKISLEGSATPIEEVLIVPRRKTPDAFTLTEKLGQHLSKKGIKAYCSISSRAKAPLKRVGKNTLKKIDLVIVLGGDGTYLEAIRLLNGLPTPILGVNLGSLGFLTDTREDELYKTLELALKGQLEKRPRTMIEVQVQRKSRYSDPLFALNDVVIERGGFPHLINLSIFQKKQHVSDVKADGLIIATPTGSTAYNLAAGGPILYPYVDAFVITPICPHSLTNRPLIFPDNSTFSFHLSATNQQEAALTVDGVKRDELKPGDIVHVKKSEFEHFVLRKSSHDYFALLKEKLKFGERAIY